MRSTSRRGGGRGIPYTGGESLFSVYFSYRWGEMSISCQAARNRTPAMVLKKTKKWLSDLDLPKLVESVVEMFPACLFVLWQLSYSNNILADKSGISLRIVFGSTCFILYTHSEIDWMASLQNQAKRLEWRKRKAKDLHVNYITINTMPRALLLDWDKQCKGSVSIALYT